MKLWKHSHVILDTTLGELDPEGTFKAMQTECDTLTVVKAGVILNEQKKEEFRKRHVVKPNSGVLKVITSSSQPSPSWGHDDNHHLCIQTHG